MYNDLNDKTFPPNEIFDIMSSFYEQYYEKRQQGSNEFIPNFLKSFHKEINSITYKENIFVNQKNTLLKKEVQKNVKSIKKKILNYQSFLWNIFYFQFAQNEKLY
jgi:ubiquitin C-terminal hydrolase